MKQAWLLFTILLIFTAACSSRTAIAPPITDTPQPSPTSPNAVTPISANVTSGPNPKTTETAVPLIPDSALFPIPWDDRSIFSAGLLPGAQSILQQLPGAPVYYMALTIDESLTMVNGRQEVRFTNQEMVDLDKIVFHLFPNLLGGELTVTNVKVNENSVNLSSEYDQSILNILLESPLKPGEQAVITLDFETQIPTELGRNYGILAATDGVLALAHFYPMLSVFDEDGWHTTPAPDQGDVVYADVGFFLVRVTLPADQTAVTSGIELDRVLENNRQTLTIAAGPVRDFYLAASQAYTKSSRIILGTTINSFAPDSLGDGAALVLDTAENALAVYGRRFGTYPFSELDLVSTPTLALGIEYPGMIAITENIYDLAENSGGTPNSIMLESTTAHEVGHQWFYSLVGNDQLAEPWLDESVTQYATWLYYVDRYGSANAAGFYQSFENRWQRVGRLDKPIGLPVGTYEGAEYSGIIYGRGPIFIRELAEAMGQSTFNEFILDYTTTYHWGIANTEDFKALAESHCDCDLTPLFQAWVYAQ